MDVSYSVWYHKANITKKKTKILKVLGNDETRVMLTAKKGVVLVVYINKAQ